MIYSSMRLARRAALLGAAALVLSKAARAQAAIETRVAAAPDGTVRMAFAARPDVCGDGDCMSTHNGHRYSRSGDVEWDVTCEGGPVRLVLAIRSHSVVAIRTYVGGRWRSVAVGSAPVTDLGTVPAKAAASYLVGLARSLPSQPGHDAIFPATLADSATIWPELASLARDESRPSETRKQAVFWLGQAAGDVTGSLDSLASDDNVDRQVREQAVFALSQRPHDEAVPALIRIAKTNGDPEVRRKALFWLGESGDPRAISLFEEILTKQ